MEILLERITGEAEVRAQIGASKSPKAGSRITLDDGTGLTVLGRDDEFYRLRFDTDEPIESCCSAPGACRCRPTSAAPPTSATTSATRPCSRATPARSRRPPRACTSTRRCWKRCARAGVEFGHITLHVGAGTFQPMRAESLSEHVMHREWLNVGALLCQQVARVRAAGGRVIAVGTTVVRALESATRDGELRPFAGDTQIFIFPGYRIRSVDAC